MVLCITRNQCLRRILSVISSLSRFHDSLQVGQYPQRLSSLLTHFGKRLRNPSQKSTSQVCKVGEYVRRFARRCYLAIDEGAETGVGLVGRASGEGCVESLSDCA